MHVLTIPLSLRFLRGQLNFFRLQGFEIHVVCAPGSELEGFSASEGVQVHELPLSRKISPLADLKNVLQLAHLLRQLRPEIVHGHTPKGGLLACIAGVVADVPVRFYHLRGLPLETATGPRKWLLYLTERITCATATEVLAVSHSLHRSVAARRLCSPGKLRVLGAGSGNGVDSELFAPHTIPSGDSEQLRSHLGIPKESRVIGFVGRLVRDKGLELLLDAWDAIRLGAPDVRLLLVGSEDGTDALRSDCVLRIARDPRIHHVPFTESIRSFYCLMDVLAFPSYREGFPNVVLEAAAMGIPAVAQRVTGSIDAVVDGRTGTLVDTGDLPAFTEALSRYLEDPARRRRHGIAARLRAVEQYSPHRIWSELLDRYEYQRLQPRQRALAQRVKRAGDVVGASVLLLGTAPAHLAAALTVRFALGRPVLFKQTRVGRNGQLFDIIKLRTMRTETDAAGSLLSDEKRLTAVGRVLRSLSLDELPQLWNILRGDMSLVGPRPLLVEYLPLYSPEQARRHQVAPGMTGWAVVNGRNSTSWPERFALDSWYVDHWSLRLDVEILAKSVLAVLQRRGVAHEQHATMPKFTGNQSTGEEA